MDLQHRNYIGSQRMLSQTASRVIALVLATIGMGSSLSMANTITVVNVARQYRCPGAARNPLTPKAALNSVATKLSLGVTLHEALRASSYHATQATELHLTGAIDDDQVSSLLFTRYCPTLTNSSFTEVGAMRHDAELWIVIATPIRFPDADVLIDQQVLRLVNRERSLGRRCGNRYFAPVHSLHLSSILRQVAKAHSEEMARYSYLAHQGRNGSTPAQRARAGGYPTQGVVGENIASGPTTANEVVSGWLASPGHCENIMDGRFVEMGLAYAVNLTSQADIYWTQLLALPR